MSTSWDIACVPCSKAREGDGARFSVTTGLDDNRDPEGLKKLLAIQIKPWFTAFGATLVQLEDLWWLESMDRSPALRIARFFHAHREHELAVVNEYGHTLEEDEAWRASGYKDELRPKPW